jgi:hypothetical protein
MEKFFNRLGMLGASLLVGGLFASQFIYIVDGGERAVKFDKIRGV